MLQRMSIAEFLGVLNAAVEDRTGYPCHPNPDGKESPFYSVQLIKTEPKNTKTSFVDRYEVWIHCVAAPVVPHSDAPVLDLVQTIEEAMTDDVDLDGSFEMFNQQSNGLQSLKKDESGEGHAVLSFYFDVQYGLRCK